ncbi:hypothetical protein F1880_008406 [Penicillium rolfsii]|nr:hypothetical protein F1880_008406 [Penicillium rolfsii]
MGAAAFSAWLFWLSWTGYKPSRPWNLPASSGLPTDFGVLNIVASAIASHIPPFTSCGRVSAVFILYGTFSIKIQATEISFTKLPSQFQTLGVEWA